MGVYWGEGTTSQVYLAPDAVIGISEVLLGADGVIRGQASRIYEPDSEDEVVSPFTFHPSTGYLFGTPYPNYTLTADLAVITDGGVAAGSLNTADRELAAVRYDDDGPVVPIRTGVGRYIDGSVNDANNLGAFVGNSQGHAFLSLDWHFATSHPYGTENPLIGEFVHSKHHETTATLYSTAVGVNDSLTIVGESYNEPFLQFYDDIEFFPERTAWLWTREGGTQTLDSLIDPSLGLHLIFVKAIANNGTILASDINNHQYLLTPIIPEPTSLLATSLLVPLLWRRRR
jgi:hypothetical protein